MKLNSLNPVFTVSEAHDLAPLGPGADLQAIGQRLALHNQRMITYRLERVVQIPENTVTVVKYAGGFAVHNAIRPHHLAAKNRGNSLVSETHAQHRNLRTQLPDGFNRDSRISRGARSGSALV